jgi:hypothetical protein
MAFACDRPAFKQFPTNNPFKHRILDPKRSQYCGHMKAATIRDLRYDFPKLEPMSQPASIEWCLSTWMAF